MLKYPFSISTSGHSKIFQRAGVMLKQFVKVFGPWAFAFYQSYF